MNFQADSSVGRAPALQAGGRRFNPCSAYHREDLKQDLQFWVDEWGA